MAYLGAALTNFLEVGSNGLLIQTAKNNYTARSIAVSGTTSLTVSNANGISGNPTINLSLVSSDVVTALGYTPVNPSAAVFTGTPTAPTAALATNTTQLATTAFVQSSLGSAGRSITTYTGTGSQTAFAIPAAVTANDVIVSVGGVILNPSTDYTISGTTLTTAVAPDLNTSIWILLLGVTVGGGYLVANQNATITGSWSFSNPILGTAVMSYNADLAERYESDVPYDVGTVVVFGGEKEITACTTKMDHRIAGIISGKPGYMMNHSAGSDETHPYVALVGRVPCKVIGKVAKGDLLVTSETVGHAEVVDIQQNPTHRIIGKSLENKYDIGCGQIEVALVR